MKRLVAKISNHSRRLPTFASDVIDHSRRLAKVANLRFALLHVQSKRTLIVVPVQIFYKDKAITTYAFLDQGSTTTLCDKNLFKNLGIEGKNVSIALTTVNKKDECYESEKAS